MRLKYNTKGKLSVVCISLILFSLQFVIISPSSIILYNAHPPYATIQGYSPLDSNDVYILPPVVDGGGWKRGTIYSLWIPAVIRASKVSFRMLVPNHTPGSDEFYYALLSCWDSAGSYDQLGIACYNGEWNIAWCWTEHDIWGFVTEYHYSHDSSNIANREVLPKYTYYIFTMLINNGDLTYIVDEIGGSNLYWSKTVHTGGYWMNLARWFTMGLLYVIYDDFTLYEEVYSTDTGTPGADFKFRYTQYYEYLYGTSWEYFDGWAEYSAGSYPSTVSITIGTTSHYVLVDNP